MDVLSIWHKLKLFTLCFTLSTYFIWGKAQSGWNFNNMNIQACECSEEILNSQNWQSVQLLTLVHIYKASQIWFDGYVFQAKNIAITANCDGLISGYDNSGIVGECYRCLQTLRGIVLSERYCFQKSLGKIASTSCVLTYQYYPENNNIMEFCPAPWPWL